MAGDLGGFAAVGFSEGLTQGIKNYNSILNNAQQRKLLSEQAAQRSEMHMEQLKQAKLNQERTALQNEAQADKNQAVDLLREAYKPVRQKEIGTQVTNLNTKWILGEVSDRDIINYFEDNPDAAMTMGLRNPKTVSSINPSDVYKPGSSLKDYMAKMFPNEGMTEDAYNQYLEKQATTMQPLLKYADGYVVDLAGLSKALPTAKKTLTKDQQRLEAAIAGIYQELYGKDRDPAEIQRFKFYTDMANNPDATEEERNYAKKMLDKMSYIGSTTPTASMREYEHFKQLCEQGDQAACAKLEKMTQTSHIINEQYDVTQATGAYTTTPAQETTTTGASPKEQYGPGAGQGILPSNQEVKTQVTPVEGLTIEVNPIVSDITTKGITPDMARKEAQFEQTPKYNSQFKKAEETYVQEAKTVDSINKVGQALDQMPKSYVSGPIDQFLKPIANALPKGSWAEQIVTSAINWDKDTFDRINQARTDSQLDTVAADILKQYSGASATEQEFMRTMLRTIGAAYEQPDVRRARFKQLVKDTNDKFLADTNRMLNNHRYSHVRDAWSIAYPTTGVRETGQVTQQQKTTAPELDTMDSFDKAMEAW